MPPQWFEEGLSRLQHQVVGQVDGPGEVQGVVFVHPPSSKGTVGVDLGWTPGWSLACSKADTEVVAFFWLQGQLSLEWGRGGLSPAC